MPHGWRFHQKWRRPANAESERDAAVEHGDHEHVESLARHLNALADCAHRGGPSPKHRPVPIGWRDRRAVVCCRPMRAEPS